MNTPSNAGKEHNPWDRKPHEYGAPEWRLLNTDEAVQIGDEYNYKDYRCEPRWAAVEHAGYLPISHTEYRRRTTPPTQSQEGGTPEIDYPCIVNGKHLSALVMCMDAILRKPEDERRKESYQKLRSMVLSENENGGIAHKHLERRLTAAQRENDRLRKMIEEAPHGEYCEATYYGSWEDRLKHCTCWKARAATEEGK